MAARPGAIINIAGTTPVDDPAYRYKMPAVYGKIEGKGNGIKTVIPNISDVGLALHRNPAEVNKFFGCELGAQTTFSEKDDRAVVNGAHTDVVLQNMIHRYIETFVLCPNCGLPETNYSIKNECIWHRCAACGAKEMIDMSHKLCTYILAQNKKSKKDKSKKDKKDKNKDGKEEKVDDTQNSAEKKKKKKKSSSSDEEKKRDDKDKVKKKKKEKKEKKEKSKSTKSFSDDDGDLAKDIDELSIDSDACVDDEGAMNLAIEGVQKYMKENPGASPKDISEVVVNQQMASALKSHDKVQIFVRAVITPNFFKDKEIQKYAPVIKFITQDNPIMQRHLIGAIEFMCVGKPKNFPVMLKLLFDENETLEEDVILEWAFDGRTEYTLSDVDEDARCALRAEAEPLIEWLQEEDSDSDSSDEESD